MTATTDAITTYKWTIDRYHQAIDAGIFEGQAIELLKGELVQMSPEGIADAGLSSNGADYLREMLGSQVKVREAKPITLPNDSEPEPDIAIVQPIPEIYTTTRHPNVDDIFWVIEYSNTSLLKDLEFKYQIYAEAGIMEYWVINLKTRELIIFRDPVNGDYRSEVSLSSGTIAPLAFPDIALEIRKFIS
ncbi:MAG: Uma2 family endonuclease [Synechococcales bacterium]|nr:Uma2 family endonuclease [Synechococcales bacterium]